MIKWAEPLAWAAIVAALCFGSYLHGLDVKQGEWDSSELAKATATRKALDAAAAAIAKIEVTSEQIVQPLRTEIRTNTVYRDCRHSDDGLLRLNAAITGQPLGASKLPRADSAK